MEKFKYLMNVPTNDGRQDQELDVRSSNPSAIMRALRHLVVLKQKAIEKTKLFEFKSIFVPIFTYGNESWVMNNRVRSQMLAHKKRFL